jgi:hypothetical protein
MIEQILSRLRIWLGEDKKDVQIRVQNYSTKASPDEIARHEPIIAEKYFDEGVNVVTMKLEAGGKCVILVDNRPFTVSRFPND